MLFDVQQHPGPPGRACQQPSPHSYHSSQGTAKGPLESKNTPRESTILGHFPVTL